MFKIDHRREVLASPYNGGHRALVSANPLRLVDGPDAARRWLASIKLTLLPSSSVESWIADRVVRTKVPDPWTSGRCAEFPNSCKLLTVSDLLSRSQFGRWFATDISAHLPVEPICLQGGPCRDRLSPINVATSHRLFHLRWTYPLRGQQDWWTRKGCPRGVLCPGDDFEIQCSPQRSPKRPEESALAHSKT